MEGHWFTKVHPGSCALMGAVAILGGIQRTTISLCVIMMEGTQQTEFLLPIIFTTVIANYIGNYFNDGVYELALHLKKVPFLDHQIHHQFFVFQARHAMNPSVRVLNLRESVGKILDVLHSTTHAGFPVVIPDTRRFVGFILRTQLLTMLQEMELGSPQDRRESDPVRARRMSTEAAPSRDRFGKLSESEWIATMQSAASDSERLLTMDLEPVMNVGPHMVTPDCPLSRTYLLFCAMGLRHLVVVDTEHHVVGIITRKDLLRVENVVRNQRLSFEQKETVVAKMQTYSEPETVFPAIEMM
eukprot:c18490_g1_i2.p1 GENE.c18490_g1_i2~~c18490_g1_i2.p1  ORF type:complete len:300 (+),score=74.42 c18490_g1_i2:208-1107(+)